MFDSMTAELIRKAPPLEGLDLDRLPEQLSEFYTKIVTARLRLRTGQIVDDSELAELIIQIQRLAFTNEALISVLPLRENRAAAAFVAAAAHQLVFNAEHIRRPEALPSFLGIHSVSPDISAMLLYLVAEASADAFEVARRVHAESDNPIEQSLIAALKALSQGDLQSIAETALPPSSEVQRPDVADTAATALYRAILKGVQALAAQMLVAESSPSRGGPVEVFQKIKSLCTIGADPDMDELSQGPVSVFSGPCHLASLLIAVASDIMGSAVTSIPPPRGIDPGLWRTEVEHAAKTRPFLWRNHREAIERGYLDRGVSAAVSFPTGAGKSTLAKLKIRTMLLTRRTTVFLAPTHALVDQTRSMLSRVFPNAYVQYRRFEEFDFLTELPDVLVMTPEACLTQMTFDASVFENTGLLVFDECHLLHPIDGGSDRRPLDAMLCVLNFTRLAPNADLLLMSAMMKNTEEIASWLEDLTGRDCLALSSSWKPTRQLRGCVVYLDTDISELESDLQNRRLLTRTKGIPASAKKAMGARPFGLFSLKQTWATKMRNDYTLSPIIDDEILLGVNLSWKLTPNSGEMSSAIAAAAAKCGIKTLIFFQTIRNAVSASNKITARSGSTNIALLDEEQQLCDIAARELGDTRHLFLKVNGAYVDGSSSVHHGLLLPEERRLIESLYRRPNGISVLTATSTVAQGMNLPSEFVIIAEDSRFNPKTDRREVLQAQELLNAAGRAGRAGYSADGIVLVVPGKVVAFNDKDALIGRHWTELREIFGQSDQCLEIDDPLTAILDRVHVNLDNAEALERYCIFKLAGGGTTEDSREKLSFGIRGSLKGFKSRRDAEDDWVTSRTEAAIRLLEAESAEDKDEVETFHVEIAATMGFSIDLVLSLKQQLINHPLPADASVAKWRRWIFRWLSDDPETFEQVFRLDDLESLFGSPFRKIIEPNKRTAYAIPYLKKLTKFWMKGYPMCDLESALGVDQKRLKTCNGARKFVVRIIPNLAYVFSLPSVFRRHAATEDENGTAFIPAALSQLGQCVKWGFDTHEKAALSYHLRNERLSRVMIHERFDRIQTHLSPDPGGETWEQTLKRVRLAMDVS